MSPDRKSPSAGFYFGMGIVVLLLLAGALVLPAAKTLVDAHANPVPAAAVPGTVLIAPGSNLYHAGAACPYAHPDAKPVATAQAVQRGLVPCPYCIGNSSGRLKPTVLPRRKR